MTLNADQVRDIAVEAARGVLANDRIIAVAVESGADTAGDPAYFITYQLRSGLDRVAGGEERSSLSVHVRDKLIEAGDETYPYVRVLRGDGI